MMKKIDLDFWLMRTKLAMYEPIKGSDDHQWHEKKDIESALQISRPSLPPDKERLVSLDVFRGLTVAVS